MKSYLVTAFLCLVSLPLLAQDLDVNMGINSGFKVVSQEAGIGLDGKLTLVKSNFIANINPLDFAFIPDGTDPRYREETFDNGTTVCRDTRNGQFADDEKCAVQFRTEYAFTTDLNYMVDAEGVNFVFGLGYRFADESTPYFNFHALFSERPFREPFHWYLHSSIGKGLFSLDVGISFQI